jgi:hypothetical protein
MITGKRETQIPCFAVVLFIHVNQRVCSVCLKTYDNNKQCYKLMQGDERMLMNLYLGDS